MSWSLVLKFKRRYSRQVEWLPAIERGAACTRTLAEATGRSERAARQSEARTRVVPALRAADL